MIFPLLQQDGGWAARYTGNEHAEEKVVCGWDIQSLFSTYVML